MTMIETDWLVLQHDVKLLRTTPTHRCEFMPSPIPGGVKRVKVYKVGENLIRIDMVFSMSEDIELQDTLTKLRHKCMERNLDKSEIE